MAWVKIDDHFDEHPKMARIGPLGLALWVTGLAYCNRNLTDGFIPWTVARNLVNWEFAGPAEDDGRSKIWTVSMSCGMSGDDVSCKTIIPLLLDAGLWDEVAGGYQVHDYDKYQPSKAQVEAERKANAERQARYRDRHSGRYSSNSNDVSNGVTSSVSNNRPDPVPVPVPKQEEANASSSRASAQKPKTKRATALPEDFPLTDEMRTFASDRDFTDAEVDLEFQKFTAYWQGEGRTKKDWPATWRSWILNAVDRRPRGTVTPFQSNGRKRDPNDVSASEWLDMVRKDAHR